MDREFFRLISFSIYSLDSTLSFYIVVFEPFRVDIVFTPLVNVSSKEGFWTKPKHNWVFVKFLFEKIIILYFCDIGI